MSVKCKQCGAKFPTIVRMAQHVRWDHREEREAAKAKALASGPKLTMSDMIKLHPEKISKMAELGTPEVWQQHPEWKGILLGRGENVQNLYQAVHSMRKRAHALTAEPTREAARAALETTKEPRKIGRPAGTGRLWGGEKLELAKQILSDFKMRQANGAMLPWAQIFEAYPQALKVFGLPDGRANGRFFSFIARTKKAMGLPLLTRRPSKANPAEPVHQNGNGNGETFTREQVDQIVAKARAEILTSVNFCPKCGHNLALHTKAYNTVLRLSSGEPH